MKKAFGGLMMVVLAGSSLLACSSTGQVGEDQFGAAEVALTNAPADVACLQIVVKGARTDKRSFPVKPGEKQLFRLNGLPVGAVDVSAGAFALACDLVSSAVEPTWTSESVTARIYSDRVTHIPLSMVHNGRASIAIDFDDQHGHLGDAEPPLSGGVFSSSPAYLVPVQAGVLVKPILTTGDAVGTKADGTPYRMVGIPDGLGAFDNGNGTFTLLANHELGATSGVSRAHGALGAFVSKWVVRKADLAVLSGEDLIQSVALWNPATASYSAPAKGVAIGRLCSADLPDETALFDVSSGLGFEGRLFFGGEEAGAEGRAFAHGLDGISYELPRLGKFSWENLVPNPKAGVKTVTIGLDDSGGGQVYVYAGTKLASGSPVERAGLTNGTLFGLKVAGFAAEDAAAGIPTTSFQLHDFGNVENWTGAQLETASRAHAVTSFQRPEDGAWDPNNPNHFYFVTTASFGGRSRLWRLAFIDSLRPELGGTIEMLLDGTEGQEMFDNLTIDKLGHVYLQEDVGGNPRLGKIWRYDIAADALVEVARHDAAFFTVGSAQFLTQDEESSGIIDASAILGPGWFLADTQSHHTIADPELVQGGQFYAIFDPSAVR